MGDSLALIGAMVVWDFFLLPNAISPDSPLYTGAFSILCFVGFMTLLVLVWIFPLQARLENKIKDTFKKCIFIRVQTFTDNTFVYCYFSFLCMVCNNSSGIIFPVGYYRNCGQLFMAAHSL